MSNKSIKDYFNVAELENHGPNHPDDNPRIIIKLKQATFGAVSTRILLEIYSWLTDLVFFFHLYSEQLAEIYTNMDMPLFFEPMLLNSTYIKEKVPLLVLVNIPVPAHVSSRLI